MKCPWDRCGAELEEGHRHVEHEAWAKDEVYEYVPVKRPDGRVDVYKKRR